MHSVRLEHTKLILIGTRTTDQATGVCVIFYPGFVDYDTIPMVCSYLGGKAHLSR